MQFKNVIKINNLVFLIHNIFEVENNKKNIN